MSPIPRSWILLVASIVVFLVLYTFSPRDNQTRRPGFAIVDTDAIADVATSHGNADAIKKKVIFGNYETAGPEDFLLPPVLQFARATFSPGAKIDSHAHKDMSMCCNVVDLMAR